MLIENEQEPKTKYGNEALWRGCIKMNDIL